MNDLPEKLAFIYEHFRIDIRGKAQGSWGAKTWVIIYDLGREKYLTSEGGRAYLTFFSVKEAVDYLLNML